MIRIKCPKCSAALKLDDDAAGEIGECDECGAKFKVPAAKAAAASKPGRDDKKRPPAGRKRSDEDDEEDDEDEDDEKDSGDKRKKAPRQTRSAKEKEAQGKANIQLVVSLVVIIILWGVGGIFISRLGQLAALFGVAALAGCGFMLAKMAGGEDGMAFFLILLGPIIYVIFTANAFLEFMMDLQGILFLLLFVAPLYGFVWSVRKWDQTQKLCIFYAACIVLFFAGSFSSSANLTRAEDKRKQIREEMNVKQVRAPQN